MVNIVSREELSDLIKLMYSRSMMLDTFLGAENNQKILTVLNDYLRNMLDSEGEKE